MNMEPLNEQNINTPTVNLLYRRIKYLLSVCSFCLGIASIITSIQAMSESEYVLQLCIYIGISASMNMLTTALPLTKEYKIIFKFGRRRAPYSTLAKHNPELEGLFAGGGTILSVWAIIILAMIPKAQLYSSVFVYVFTIYHILAQLGLFILFTCCFPCFMCFYGTNARANEAMFENALEALATANIKHQIEEINDIGKIEEEECCICFGNQPNCLVLPCKHNSFCIDCITKVKICPLCRANIVQIKKLSKHNYDGKV